MKGNISLVSPILNSCTTSTVQNQPPLITLLTFKSAQLCLARPENPEMQETQFGLAILGNLIMGQVLPEENLLAQTEENSIRQDCRAQLRSWLEFKVFKLRVVHTTFFSE